MRAVSRLRSSLLRWGAAGALSQGLGLRGKPDLPGPFSRIVSVSIATPVRPLIRRASNQQR
jgi:hypothetical protein